MKLSGKNLRIQRQSLGLSQAKLSELCSVPQHMLSAFELDKAELPEALLEIVVKSLANTDLVSTIAQRGKRYREHAYASVPRIAARIRRASITSGNEAYVALLNQFALQHSEQKKEKINALSLFSGCGGFSLGFSAAGYRIKGFLELQPELREIYRLNFPDSQELGGDITKVTNADLLHFKELIGSIDVIIGGPPCQGFSLSGKRDVDDPRNNLFRHYLRFVDVFRPKIAVLENVKLLTSMKDPKGKFVKDQISENFQRHGYQVKFFEINAKDYGVPQSRDRVIFIACRNDIGKLPSMPAATHDSATDLFGSTSRYVTFGDACSDLEYLESGEKSKDVLHEAVNHPKHVIDWLWDVPEGSSAHDNDDESKRPPSGYNTTYKRQIWTEPAATVQTTFGMISGCRNVHPIATRSLTIREATRIQTFPDSYKFCGNLGAIRTGIGNAVPPLLAYKIGLHLRDVLNLVEVARL